MSQIELNWLLDDTVDAVQVSADSQWQACTWRQLQSSCRPVAAQLETSGLHDPKDMSNTFSQSIALRADINTLAQLWKQRTHDRCVFHSLSNRHQRKDRRVETRHLQIFWRLNANDKPTCNVKTLTSRFASCSNLGLQKDTCHKASPIPCLLLHSGKPLDFAVLT